MRPKPDNAPVFRAGVPLEHPSGYIVRAKLTTGPAVQYTLPVDVDLPKFLKSLPPITELRVFKYEDMGTPKGGGLWEV